MESLQKEAHLTQAQMRALKELASGNKAVRGRGVFVTINDKNICTLQTMDALVRRGVIDAIAVDDKFTFWEVNETGLQLAKLLFSEL